MKYTEEQLATAIDALIQLVEKNVGVVALEKVRNDHPCVNEIWEFGPTGPVGLGLGRFGGHAVG